MYINFKPIINQAGQTLVTLLVFSVVALAVTTTAISVTINTSHATQAVENRVYVQHAAQSGIENALLRMLRNPSYVGETLSVDDALVVTTVTGSDPYTITATANNGLFSHTQEAQVTYTNNILTISSWTSSF
ncbi:MAG: hypothetical protein O3B87_04545 [bacterium]|nr:hypothetical protein [bacterium]